MGVAYRGIGELEAAVVCYHEALRLQPVYPEAEFNLGIALHEQEEHAAAEECFRHVLERMPDNPDVLLNLGNTLQAREQFDEASTCFFRILDQHADHFEAQFNLANCYKEQRQHIFAADHFRRAVEINPQSAETHFQLANMLQLQERHEEAVECYMESLTIDPNRAEVHNNLGATWHGLRQFEQAVASYQKSIELDANYAEAHNNLGRSLFLQGKSQDALASIHRALDLKPALPDAYVNMGEIYCSARQMEQACRCFEQAISLDSDNIETWRRLASVYRCEHRVDEAKDAFRRCTGKTIDDPLPQLWLEAICPAIHDDEQSIDDYRSQYESAVARVSKLRPRPTFEDITVYGSIPPSNLQFQNRNNRSLLEAIAEVYRGCVPVETPRPGTGKPKIGFVVTSGHEGIFYRYMGHTIEQLNRDLFEPVIICSPTGAESIRRLRTGAATELMIVSFRHDLLIEEMRSARFDVLYHFEVGTDLTNYFLPFYRLAPIQCVSGGISQTTGLKEIDYFLSSELQEPDDADEHYTETLIRTRGMPSFQPRSVLPASPKTREDFGLRTGQTFYACPQKLRKFQPDFDPLLREILDRDANGILVLVEDYSGAVAAKLRQRFERTMPDVVDRVRFVPRLSISDYFSLTAAADVLLDPLHYGGGATMYDAMSFNKPMVSLPGRFLRGRYALGFYRHMGIDDCIASSPADYVEKAVMLGTDIEYRRTVERRITETAPVVFDDTGIVEEYERVFLQLVEEARGTRERGTAK